MFLDVYHTHTVIFQMSTLKQYTIVNVKLYIFLFFNGVSQLFFFLYSSIQLAVGNVQVKNLKLSIPNLYWDTVMSGK